MLDIPSPFKKFPTPGGKKSPKPLHPSPFVPPKSSKKHQNPHQRPNARHQRIAPFLSGPVRRTRTGTRARVRGSGSGEGPGSGWGARGSTCGCGRASRGRSAQCPGPGPGPILGSDGRRGCWRGGPATITISGGAVCSAVPAPVPAGDEGVVPRCCTPVCGWGQGRSD